MTLNYTVVTGTIKFVLFDDRQDSPTFGQIQEIYPGEDDYCRVTVPPGIWNGFMGIGLKEAFVINVTDIPHDPEEIIRRDPFDPKIPFSWGIKYR
jgi:dTDP-4-dehydrorhamnose 3,5-epimerase